MISWMTTSQMLTRELISWRNFRTRRLVWHYCFITWATEWQMVHFAQCSWTKITKKIQTPIP